MPPRAKKDRLQKLIIKIKIQYFLATQLMLVDEYSIVDKSDVKEIIAKLANARQARSLMRNINI